MVSQNMLLFSQTLKEFILDQYIFLLKFSINFNMSWENNLLISGGRCGNMWSVFFHKRQKTIQWHYSYICIKKRKNKLPEFLIKRKKISLKFFFFIFYKWNHLFYNKIRRHFFHFFFKENLDGWSFAYY